MCIAVIAAIVVAGTMMPRFIHPHVIRLSGTCNKQANKRIVCCCCIGHTAAKRDGRLGSRSQWRKRIAGRHDGSNQSVRPFDLSVCLVCLGGAVSLSVCSSGMEQIFGGACGCLVISIHYLAWVVNPASQPARPPRTDSLCSSSSSSSSIDTAAALPVRSFVRSFRESEELCVREWMSE